MKKLLVFNQHQALCSGVGEAVEFINSIPGLTCNDVCRSILEALFNEDSHVFYPSGNIKGGTDNRGKFRNIPVGGFATTGCGTNRIRFFDALADTLEEHKELYKAKCEVEKRKRIAESRERERKRLAVIKEHKPGWYRVSLWCKMVRQHDMRLIDYQFSGECLADSALHAYEKAVRHLKDSEVSFFSASGSTSHDFEFEYLGVKDDYGYTGLTWEEYENKEYEEDRLPEATDEPAEGQ